MDRNAIEEMGEESGREEAADEYPYQDKEAPYRKIRHRGRARAQGLYELRGHAARVFARCWAVGYQANCRILEEFSMSDSDQAHVKNQ